MEKGLGEVYCVYELLATCVTLLCEPCKILRNDYMHGYSRDAFVTNCGSSIALFCLQGENMPVTVVCFSFFVCLFATVTGLA